MALNLSIGQMLAKLEAKVAHHREKKAFHAEQEILHRDQAASHAAALETALAHLEAFKTASLCAGELLEKDEGLANPAAEAEEEINLRGKRALSQMVAKVIEGKAPTAAFGATTVTQEIEDRWGAKLRRRPDSRSVAAALRRWAAAGSLHQVREGRAYHESLYRKTP